MLHKTVMGKGLLSAKHMKCVCARVHTHVCGCVCACAHAHTYQVCFY